LQIVGCRFHFGNHVFCDGFAINDFGSHVVTPRPAVSGGAIAARLAICR
jgi:hypothetical protein